MRKMKIEISYLTAAMAYHFVKSHQCLNCPFELPCKNGRRPGQADNISLCQEIMDAISLEWRGGAFDEETLSTKSDEDPPMACHKCGSRRIIDTM